MRSNSRSGEKSKQRSIELQLGLRSTSDIEALSGEILVGISLEYDMISIEPSEPLDSQGICAAVDVS